MKFITIPTWLASFVIAYLLVLIVAYLLGYAHAAELAPRYPCAPGDVDWKCENGSCVEVPRPCPRNNPCGELGGSIGATPQTAGAGQNGIYSSSPLTAQQPVGSAVSSTTFFGGATSTPSVEVLGPERFGYWQR